MNKSINRQKYLSYKKAWERIEQAITDGWHLEAITIQESIISDRLLSYILGVAPKSKIGHKTGLGELIKQWRKNAGNTLLESDGSDLGQLAFRWKENRNTAVHGLVKSSPGTPTMPPDDFLARARETAEEGKDLARKIQNWHRKMLRNSKG